MSAGQSALETFREAEGRQPVNVIIQGISGWFIALGVAAISGLQTVFEFLLLPFILFIDVAEAAIQAFFITPTRLLPFGLAESARGLIGTGLFGLPISAGVALGTLLLVIGFLALSITSNAIPGIVVDNPIWDFFFETPEEEAEGED